MRLLLVLAILPLVCLGEPSAFERQSGATKKDLSNLQTISKQNKVDINQLQSAIVKLQGEVQRLSGVVNSLGYDFEEVKTRQEGISTIFEGNNKSSQILSNKQNQQGSDIEILKSEINSLNSFITAHQESIQALQKQLKELQELSIKTQDTILKELRSISVEGKKSLQQSAKNTQSKQQSFDKNQASDKLLLDGREAIKNKNYRLAKDIMLFLKNKNYERGEVTFQLGEISYLQRDYELAIRYYKQSVAITDNNWYMPILLAHTALSFKGLKDQNNYEIFVKLLHKNYPDSPQAKQFK